MAQYRLLSDHWIGELYLPAGTVASTADGTLPVDWVPSGAVEPLDGAAVAAFHAAGPQITPLVRAQWSGVPVFAPVTSWRQIPGGRMFQLTGLGSGLAAVERR
jgi:hypothetical protein